MCRYSNSNGGVNGPRLTSTRCLIRSTMASLKDLRVAVPAIVGIGTNQGIATWSNKAEICSSTDDSMP